MSIPWIVECKREYRHLFLTIKMEKKNATISLKEACWQANYYEGWVQLMPWIYLNCSERKLG